MVQLADGTEMNLLRPAGLREISFELLLPYFEDSPLLRNGVRVYKPIYYLNRLAEWAAGGEPRRIWVLTCALPCVCASIRKRFAANMWGNYKEIIGKEGAACKPQFWRTLW